MIIALTLTLLLTRGHQPTVRHWPKKHGVDLDSYRQPPKAGPGAPPHHPRHQKYLVIDRSDSRMWVMKDAKPVVEIGISTGRIINGRSLTPVGRFVIDDNQEWPEWLPSAKDRPSFIRAFGQKFPAHGAVPGGSPMNALGARALHLAWANNPSKESHLYIHGHSCLPFVTGSCTTSGCLSLGNADAGNFSADGVGVGTVVFIQN